jgi:hypothetical protein
MQAEPGKWLSTEQIGERIGMTAEWVRRQVLAGRLRGVAFRTGNRATYRIREVDLRRFLKDWSVTSDRPEWEDFLAGIPVSPLPRGPEVH